VEVCLLRTGAGLGASRKRAVSPLIILTIIQKTAISRGSHYRMIDLFIER